MSRTPRTVSVLARIGALPLALALAGCLGERTTTGTATPDPRLAGPVRTPPPFDLIGRWSFSAVAGPTCTMNFTSGGVGEGGIQPGGGCPGNFYQSRKWTYENGVLFIRNHTGETLAQMRAGAGGFSGQATTGQQVSLAR